MHEPVSGEVAFITRPHHSLPVLSLKSVSHAPRVSTVIKLLQRTFFLAKEFATIASDIVILAGRPSGFR